MLFMNRYEIERACAMYTDHAVLGAAAATVRNVADWADANSDGWCYWPKPCRAAERVIRMIVRDGTSAYYGGARGDATAEEYRTACRALKSFRTRYGADFRIVAADEDA